MKARHKLTSRHRAVIAGAAAVVGVAALVGSIDQGSLARTMLPRPLRRGLPDGLAGDVHYLRRAVRRHELGATREQWLRFVEVLSARRCDSVDELTLTVSEALAQFDNAATGLLGTSAHRLPVRFSWMADDLVVVKARPEYADLVGQRVLRIAGGAPWQIWPQFRRFIGGGTQAWARNRSAWFLSVPAALARAGQLADAGAGVRLETESLAGAITETLMHADPEPMPGGPMADFRDRFPGDAGLGTRGWLTALQETDDLPMSQRRVVDRLMLETLPRGEESVAYVRLLGTPAGGDPTSEMVEQCRAQVTAGQWQRFVVDVRYASGGDYRTVLPLVKAVAERARELAVPIRMIIGPNTIGGGLIAASQLIAHAPERTTLIGNQVGDELKFRGQGRTITLPVSGLTVQLCHDWHDVSTDPHPWGDVWLPDKFLLLGVGDLVPDIAVQNSWRDYLQHTDRMLEAALDAA